MSWSNPRSTPRRLVLWALIVAMTLVAAACSGTSTSADAGADPAPGDAGQDEGVSSAGATVLSPAVDDDEDEETIEDLELQWADDREGMVADLNRSGYGIGPESVLSGPGGFEVDLSACPEGWADAAPDGPIKIGLTVAKSGDFAGFNRIAVGMQAYFDYVNELGGIDGRPIELIVKDDAYDPELTETAVAELLETDAPFYITSVGTPGALAVYDTLNEACVPQPFVVSAHPALGDPEEHPFTTGLELSYPTEATLWGSWIKQNLSDQLPVSVGALVIDNDFGQIYADSFENWAAANRSTVSSFTTVTHDPGADNVTAEMTELAEARPTVFISMTAGDACILAIREADALGLTSSASALFTPSDCRQPEVYLAPVSDSADGFYSVGEGVKSTLDPLYAEETFMAFVEERLVASGLDPSQGLLGVGFAQYGWTHVELLRIASALPGGLTRSNLLIALRGANLHPPVLLDGISFATSGNRDAYFIEGAEYSRYDSSAGAWIPDGPVADVNGSTPNCKWIQLVCER